MQDTSERVPNRDALGFDLPTPEEGLAEGKRRLAQTFQRGELIWLVDERYDPTTPAWIIDIVRPGAAGCWMRQRYRFDEQAQVLYFLGESPLSDEAFRAVRRQSPLFPVDQWQDQ